MAHPASYRQIGHRPDVVPKANHSPSDLQRQVGTAVAALYGTGHFDTDTFVCRGSGRPVGTPVLEVQASEHETQLFNHVDRSRGDTLLALAWVSRPPARW